ncbi:MAG: SPOR domain-containing protein [Balneolales bacterium]
MKKTAIVFVLIMTLHLNNSSAQDLPSSWSMDLLGGMTMGQFTYGANITPQGALNIRYSLNPLVSFYGTAGVGRFQSSDGITNGASYENNYLNFGLGTRVNVLRMALGPASLTNWFGLYTITGLSVIRNDVAVSDVEITSFPSQDHTGLAMLYRIGGGLTIRISRRLDFFTQSELQISDSDLLDGYERSSGTELRGNFANGDAFINTSAGLSLKFGQRAIRHSDWVEHDHRIDPLSHSLSETITHIEAELDSYTQHIDSTNGRIRILEQSLEDLNHLVATVHSEQFINQHNQIENLQTRLHLLQSEIQEISDHFRERNEVQEVRYYVVAGVFNNLENAENLLWELRNGAYDDAEIIRDRSRSYYLVSYSGHTTETEANTRLSEIRRNVNPDSWVYIR